MTSQSNVLIDIDTKAKIEVLVAGRVEDRETIKELANDMKEMAKNVSTMAIAITEQTKDNHHLSTRVGKVEKTQDLEAKKLEKVQNVQEGNKVRWWFLGTVVSVIITFTIAFTALFWKPSQDNMIQGKRTTKLLETIESIMIENYSKEKAEAIVKSNRGK